MTKIDSYLFGESDVYFCDSNVTHERHKLRLQPHSNLVEELAVIVVSVQETDGENEEDKFMLQSFNFCNTSHGCSCRLV